MCLTFSNVVHSSGEPFLVESQSKGIQMKLEAVLVIVKAVLLALEIILMAAR